MEEEIDRGIFYQITILVLIFDHTLYIGVIFEY